MGALPVCRKGSVFRMGAALWYYSLLHIYSRLTAGSSSVPHHGACYLCSPLCMYWLLYFLAYLTLRPASYAVLRCANACTSPGPLHFFFSPPLVQKQEYRIRDMRWFRDIMFLVV
jgi:hypothetical protein